MGRQAKPNDLPQAWETDRISIFEYLQSQPDEAQPSHQKNFRLPDEEEFYRGKGELRWAPGALDGVLGHHTTGGDKNGGAVLSALTAASEAPSSENLRFLYSLLLKEGAFGSIDPILSSIRNGPSAHLRQTFKIAMWLASQSPDREPVKFGIALLGMFVATPSGLLQVLGRHDEFTLYSAVALANILPDGARDAALWRLAKQVHGWGRIHVVERLAATANPDIKAWLLREGYKNSVMHGYLAYPCATGGDLLNALRKENPDEALLKGAGDILTTLAGGGGPGELISAYADGAEAVWRYVDHMARIATPDLGGFLSLNRIMTFLDRDDRDWAKLEQVGWTEETRRHISTTAKQILSRPEWPALIRQDLQAAIDNRNFRRAAEAAGHAGIDPWEARFERQRSGKDDQWYFLMQTDDRARASRVVDLAIQQLDLGKIATGPGTTIGMGPEFEHHHALDFILAGLGKFPGLGWQLIDTGLQSPVTPNRHAALRALAEWGRESQSQEIIAALNRALAKEPTNEVRKNIEQVLAVK